MPRKRPDKYAAIVDRLEAVLAKELAYVLEIVDTTLPPEKPDGFDKREWAVDRFYGFTNGAVAMARAQLPEDDGRSTEAAIAHNRIHALSDAHHHIQKQLTSYVTGHWWDWESPVFGPTRNDYHPDPEVPDVA